MISARKILCIAAIAALALPLNGCSRKEYYESKQVPVPVPPAATTTTVVVPPATLAPAAGPVRSFNMTDAGGYQQGSVEFDAGGGGRIYDNGGRIIGTITPSVRR